MKIKNESKNPRDALREPRQWYEWRNIKHYAFNIRDIERWFVKEQMKDHTMTPKNLLKLENEKMKTFVDFTRG